MLWFQCGLDQTIGLFLYVGLDAFWHLVLEFSWRARSPDLFRHPMESSGKPRFHPHHPKANIFFSAYHTLVPFYDRKQGEVKE